MEMHFWSKCPATGVSWILIHVVNSLVGMKNHLVLRLPCFLPWHLDRSSGNLKIQRTQEQLINLIYRFRNEELGTIQFCIPEGKSKKAFANFDEYCGNRRWQVVPLLRQQKWTLISYTRSLLPPVEREFWPIYSMLW